jgi:hypothetical protein
MRSWLCAPEAEPQAACWKLLQRAENGGLAFECRELIAKTKMRSRAEREVRVVRAGQVERIGIFELRGVTIGGSKGARFRRINSFAFAV